MNAQQRKFLIERIQQKVKDKIKALQDSYLEYPSASNFIFKAILNNELKLQPEDVILNTLKQKALNAKDGQNWLSEERMGANKETSVRIPLAGFIVLPEDYYKEYTRVESHNRKIKEDISVLKIQLDTIEVRIQLASDKRLEKLINEVDDMGDLSLIDTNLKLLLPESKS